MDDPVAGGDRRFLRAIAVLGDRHLVLAGGHVGMDRARGGRANCHSGMGRGQLDINAGERHVALVTYITDEHVISLCGDYFLIASTAAACSSRRKSEASAFGSPVRWMSRMTNRSCLGSSQACVPKAPPCP